MLPIVEELDLAATPFELFAPFTDLGHAILLDSGMDPQRLGRYSYLSADPFVIVRSRGRNINISQGAVTITAEGDPFRYLQSLLRQHRTAPISGLPSFQGGLAGYFGYDLGHHVERLPRQSHCDVEIPELYVGLYDWVLAHDHLSQRTWLIATGGADRSVEQARWRIAWIKERLLPARAVSLARERPRIPRRFVANFTHDQYLEAIRVAKEYIAAGDIYQVNLSQRFQTHLSCHPWRLYTRLREVNPAPFAAYLGFEDVAVVSASPEQFLKVEGRCVETRPIKGTRPRGKDPASDQALAEDLLTSEKDRAENVMIVDLLRNDIGRVCRVGSVHVPELFVLERYPTVFHLVSTVEGELDEGFDALDLLRACFPGGSVTGCPKIRSMEIIDELEPTRRGVYCGAIGYVSFTGDMNTSIVIRTLVVKDGQVHFQVGGAIVADSDPQSEYDETLDKARASMLALETLAEDD